MPLLKQILTKLKDIDIKVLTGQEVKTNEIIDGKRVYKKNIDCGNLPNASSKTIAIDGGYRPNILLNIAATNTANSKGEATAVSISANGELNCYSGDVGGLLLINATYKVV